MRPKSGSLYSLGLKLPVQIDIQNGSLGDINAVGEDIRDGKVR